MGLGLSSTLAHEVKVKNHSHPRSYDLSSTLAHEGRVEDHSHPRSYDLRSKLTAVLCSQPMHIALPWLRASWTMLPRLMYQGRDYGGRRCADHFGYETGKYAPWSIVIGCMHPILTS